MRNDVPLDPEDFAHPDAGPYRPWLDPLLLAASGATEQARGATEQARRALTTVPHPARPPPEALWCVLARADETVGTCRSCAVPVESSSPPERSPPAPTVAWSPSAESPVTWKRSMPP
ncbi:hypothetical protein ACFQ9H_05960 [Streptomyces sp. NPDC056517]